MSWGVSNPLQLPLQASDEEVVVVGFVFFAVGDGQMGTSIDKTCC
jgi:hypothetical protein